MDSSQWLANYTLSRGQAKNPMLVFFTPFLPLAIVLLGVLVILAGFWTLWRIVASWFWFGMWQMWR